MVDIIYPAHKHPHGVDNTFPNEYRLWACEECGHIFTDNEIRLDRANGWGHTCK
jgi:hypothetical protein